MCISDRCPALALPVCSPCGFPPRGRGGGYSQDRARRERGRNAFRHRAGHADRAGRSGLFARRRVGLRPGEREPLLFVERPIRLERRRTVRFRRGTERSRRKQPDRPRRGRGGHAGACRTALCERARLYGLRKYKPRRPHVRAYPRRGMQRRRCAACGLHRCVFSRLRPFRLRHDRRAGGKLRARARARFGGLRMQSVGRGRLLLPGFPRAGL